MHKIAAQITSLSQKLMTYFKLPLTISKYKAVISVLSSDLNNDDNGSNNEEKDSMSILQSKKHKIQSINLPFISIRNKAGNQNYNL